MAKEKPGIPKGTRDFNPVEIARRNYIFDTIKQVFQLYGYNPIETPSMENLSTLMGKYGEEGDRLIFRILNSGDYLSKVEASDLNSKDSNKLSAQICEKALRYDLTVPFARYVVQYQHEINFPFKRYQIQPVWRADKPQRGRYREFYQCDVDVIGSDSLYNEAELVKIVDDIFKALGINVLVKLNNRKILTGIAEFIGESEKIIDITIAIDKLDKIGLDNVKAELASKGLSSEAIKKLEPVLLLQGTNEAKLNKLGEILKSSEIGLLGIAEIREVFSIIEKLSIDITVELDLTLARGLNYYTGAIIEVKAVDVAMGSISGGGRYDDLTGIFGLPGVSGVGISFGADRIYDVLNELNKFPENTSTSTSVIAINFGENELKYNLDVLNALRNEGIKCQLFPEDAKMKKQMQYASKVGVPFVIMAGQEEIDNKTVTLKNMVSGEQKNVSIQQAIDIIKKL
ncbi:MAG: histidine--tRNA ligase [Bacteroidetes bacterium]|nr:histidine--tRNA ligase [Bacteroidota bacterium]